MRLFENKGHILAPAAFHSTSALKQPASGFHRTQTCVLTTNVAFSKCYGNPPFKNMQPTPANMAGIMATCGYNWASRAPGGWAPIYWLLTPGIIPVPLVIPHTHGFTGCENVVFFLSEVLRKVLFIWWMRMVILSGAWSGPPWDDWNIFRPAFGQIMMLSGLNVFFILCASCSI